MSEDDSPDKTAFLSFLYSNIDNTQPYPFLMSHGFRISSALSYSGLTMAAKWELHSVQAATFLTIYKEVWSHNIEHQIFNQVKLTRCYLLLCFVEIVTLHMYFDLFMMVTLTHDCAAVYWSLSFVFYMFFLQEQVHKTVLEISLPVPLLISPLHEGKHGHLLNLQIKKSILWWPCGLFSVCYI